MGYVLEEFRPSSREVWLKDDWAGTDHKILVVPEWNGYESDIDVRIEDSVATITLSSGITKRFDLSQGGNRGVEI